MIKATVIAGLGGFIGTMMRFLSEKFGALLEVGSFPAGTFLANMLGCFLIGIFYGWAVNRDWFGEKWNLFLITGLCGGLTTFSSFSDDMISLLQKGDTIVFILYLLGSVVMGLAAVACGIACIGPKQQSVTK